MRRKWTDEKVGAAVLAIAEGGVMPTISEMRRKTGSYALSCQVAQRGGVDRWATELGLRPSQHASRFGWRWEQWFADQARARGCSVDARNGVKCPWDVMVNGQPVDVKAASGAEHAGGRQFTWRVEKPPTMHFALIAVGGLDGKSPPALFIVPPSHMSSTCATARWGRRQTWGKWARWRDRWDLLNG